MTVIDIQTKKNEKKPIVMLTAYDAITADLASKGGVDIILVGDSLANTVLGMDNTLPVTLDEMFHHAKAVKRKSSGCFLVFDMPFLSYRGEIAQAVLNCGRALKEAGCNAVKIEGGMEIIPLVRELVYAGIPVMGHLGLMPQRVNVYGGMFVQGKKKDDEKLMINTALALEEAGIFALVLECIPEGLAAKITKKIHVPTIGIGAGRDVDGQVLVISDMLGMTEGKAPRHNKRYANFFDTGKTAVEEFVNDVRQGKFPEEGNIF